MELTSFGVWRDEQYERRVSDVNGDGRADIVGFAHDKTLTGLSGSADNDLLNGGKGDDVLRGGLLHDNFVFSARDFGNDAIFGFETGAGSDDIVHFDVEVFSNFETVIAAASDDGTGTVIRLDTNNSIRLKGVQTADLSVNDFQFL